MLKILLLLAVIIALAILPVLYTARAVGAERASVGWVVLCLVVQSALTKAFESFAVSEPLATILGFLGSALVYQLLLQTTFVKGLIISAVSTAVVLVGVVLMAAALS
ncbi:hypothetical protein [Lysobacter sp. CA199]|uniref:hypothetical protein n=1 Tax=Lysobacter sp. CA199 TaxID=3455608 RepID=UPI003F8D1A36